jgi:hypothetical protein
VNAQAAIVAIGNGGLERGAASVSWALPIQNLVRPERSTETVATVRGQLEAYLGLVPREYSSGETQRRGAITKAGHPRALWLLIQAAVSILRRRPPQAEELRTWALRIAARRDKHVAVVALARRLALYALLRDGSVFEPARSASSWSRCGCGGPRGHVNASTTP